jgi:tellurium resistance protein TerD
MIELVKRGQSVELQKDGANLTVINVCLSWDTQRYSGREPFDLDVSVFALNASGKCRDDRDIVFYGQQKHESGAIIHSGDNRDGTGDGDDEVITIDLTKVPTDVTRIVGVVSIYDWKNRNQNFGSLNAAHVRIDDATKTGPDSKLFQYDLVEKFGVQTGVKLLEIYRYEGAWKAKFVADGYDTGLGGFVREYGLTIKGLDV